MSVAVNPCYRDDAFQSLAKHLGVGKESYEVLLDVLDFDVDPCGDYVLPGNLKAGNVKKQAKIDNDIIDKLYCGSKNKVNHSFLKTFRDYNRVYFGLPAVHRFFSHLCNIASRRGSTDDSDVPQKLFVMGTVIGQHTPKDSIARGPVLKSVWKQYGQAYYELFASYLRLVTHYKNSKYRYEVRWAKNEDKEMPSVEDISLSQLGVGRAYVFQGLLVCYVGFTCYVFHRKDGERLERMIKGYGLANYYIRTYSLMTNVQRQQVVGAFTLVTDELRLRSSQSDMKSAQVLCRAFDVAYYTVLAHFASDIDEVSLKEQRDKAIKEGLNKIANINSIVENTKILPMRDAIEVLQIYKIFPQADFDQYSATYKQKKLYEKQNKITDRGLWLSVMRHHKLLMVKAYYERHKVCPGVLVVEENDKLPYWTRHYPHVDPQNIKPEQTDWIDFKGQFLYMDHMLDVFDMVKDKSICPLYVKNIKHIRDVARLPPETKNQLLDVISRDTPISVAYLRDTLDDLFIDIKAEDKAEAKKPDGRWFMEAHTDYRLVLSEYEMSVANYGSNLEGFMQGKGLIEKQKMLNHVAEATDVTMGVTQLFISFDIAKFSPRMPIEVHQELDKQWSEAFGMQHIQNMSRIFTEGEMHYIKTNIHHTLQKTGSDFEGFAGRKLTMFHLAVMHAVVDVLRAEKLILGSARYAAQIDDGVLRVNVKTDKINDTVNLIRKRISELWIACGMEISWDKTFVSANFAMFLNEIRFQGRAIGCGMRAAVKVTNAADVPVQNFMADVQMAESTVRGAIVAGAPPVPLYYLYSYMVYDTIKKWAKKDYQFGDRCLPFVFAPINLGGIGMANILSLMGSLEHDAFQVGISNIKLIAHRFPNYAKYCNNIVNQDMQPITAEKSVTNPTGIRRQAKTFRTDRLLVAMRNALVFWLNKPTMHAYGFVRGVAISEIFAKSISDRQNIPVEVRELWYESTIKSSVDAIVMKVLTAKTAFNLVPRRAIFRLVMANLNEARQVLNSW